MTRTIGAVAVPNYEDYCMFFPRFYFLFWQRVGYKKIEETFFFLNLGVLLFVVSLGDFMVSTFVWRESPTLS